MNLHHSEYTETRIGAYLREIKNNSNNSELNAPVKVGDFYKRMMRLTERAINWGIKPPENAFRVPTYLDINKLPALVGKININDRNALASQILEMLLLTFEAKPRPISFAITGYSPIDFMAYIYQDVYCKEKEIPLKTVENDFTTHLSDIIDWLRSQDNTRSKSENNAVRHIRYRCSMLFDVNYSTIRSWQNKPEGSIALTNLVSKLLECDQDSGYANGSLRNFRLVRQDFNLLGEYCFLLRKHGNPEEMEKFKKIICPSKVTVAFSLIKITKGTGRKPGGKNKKRSEENTMDNRI